MSLVGFGNQNFVHILPIVVEDHHNGYDLDDGCHDDADSYANWGTIINYNKM